MYSPYARVATQAFILAVATVCLPCSRGGGAATLNTRRPRSRGLRRTVTIEVDDRGWMLATFPGAEPGIRGWLWPRVMVAEEQSFAAVTVPVASCVPPGPSNFWLAAAQPNTSPKVACW